MRGAPHVGFSVTIRKISSRTSLLIGFLPTAFRACEIQLQYGRKPVRCQRTTVSGVTRINDLSQPDQTSRKTTRNSLSNGTQSRARSLDVQSQQLLPKSEVLEEVFSSRAKGGDNPAEQMSKAHEHQGIIAKARRADAPASH